MERQQQSSSIKINPELFKKIQQVLSTNPNADQSKVFDLIQNDTSLRLKKQIMKTGINEYFKKYVIKPQIIPQKNGNTTKNQSIDLTLDNIKKKVKKNQVTYDFEDNESYKFQNLGGISEIKVQIDETLLQYVNNRSIYKTITKSSPNRGYLISGSVGSGKTLLANCILSELNSKLYNCYFINAFELCGNDADQKIKKIFQLLEQKVPSVLCIDNIEQICSKQANKRPQGSCLSTLCINIDKSLDKQMIFIATTSSPQKLDVLTKPGRFYKPFKIMNPNDQQRKQIFTKNLKNYQNNLIQSQISQIIKLTSGFVAADLTSFIQEAMNKCVKRLNKNNQQQKLLIFEDFTNSFKEVQPVLKRQGFAKIPTTKLSDIGALENIKDALINQIILPMKSKDKFKKLNFEVNGGGVLLYGPPGCGKTMLAKGIANQANVNFITVKGPQLLTKYVGQSQQAVRKVFQRARNSAPSVIFFDQFDALAPKRQDSGNQVTQRVVNTLLNELNGVDDRKMIFVIAATNRPDIIDQAVLRSGRIQLKLQVPMPCLSDRIKILQKVTSKVSKIQQLDIKMVAQKAQKFSGADLAYLVKKSIISAVSNDRQGITTQDLLNALQSFKKQNTFGKKPLQIMEQEQQENKQFKYHPQESFKKGKNESGINGGVDNQLQKNKKDMTNNKAQGILDQFINFLAYKSSKVQKK